MLKELGITLDEPRTQTEVKLRKAYKTLVGREPDIVGLNYWAREINNGNVTLANVVQDSVNGVVTEIAQYISQGNGNPVVNLVMRNNDGTANANESAFNTNLDREVNLGYTLTGDILSLPYEHEVFLQNKLASSNVNINPFGVASFIGTLTLNPPDNSLELKPTSTPTVFNDTNDAYTTIVNSFKAEYANKEGFVVNLNNDTGFYGSYYGEWELVSQGAVELDTSANKYVKTDVYSKYKFDFSIIPSTVTSSTGGVRSDKVYDTNIRPKMGDISIAFSAQGMKPNTRVYAFFGDRAVSNMSVMYTQMPTGQDIPSRTLVTDSTGSIKGTFNYRESDLNFDAGVYVLALTDSISNNNNRTTYAAAPFNGLGLPGYGDEIRTRIGTKSVNKTSTIVSSDARTTVIGDANNPDPDTGTGTGTENPAPEELTTLSNLDIIDFCFVYGLGRKPSTNEKAGIYDKWQTYDVHNITTWNSIQNKSPSTGSTTTGVEMWYTNGFPVNDSVLTYTDRSITVVPNGTDSADLRTKYLNAVTYPYGRWTWWHLKDEPTFPATVNYTQFINTDPAQALTPPWMTDLGYDSFNADGRKVFNVLRTFVLDVIGLNGKLTPQDYQGILGFAAREYDFIYYDNAGLAAAGTPGMPKTYTAVKNAYDFSSNVHNITTVWNTIGSDCQQPYKVVVSAEPVGPTKLLSLTITPSTDAFYTPPGGSVDYNTGNVVTTNPTLLIGGGLGPLWSINQPAFPLSLAHGAYGTGKLIVDMADDLDSDGKPDHVNWSFVRPGSAAEESVAIGGPTNIDPIIGSTPYRLVGLHYGNGIAQILIGIKDGQVGEATNRPIRITTSGGGVFDTWIPSTGLGYWQFTITSITVGSNFVDVYNQDPGKTDPLNLKSHLELGAPFVLEIWTRDTAAAAPSPVGSGSGGYIDDGNASDMFSQLSTTGQTS